MNAIKACVDLIFRCFGKGIPGVAGATGDLGPGGLQVKNTIFSCSISYQNRLLSRIKK